MAAEATDKVPAPLGWCAFCLGDDGKFVPAVSLVNGTAACRPCVVEVRGNLNSLMGDYQ